MTWDLWAIDALVLALAVLTFVKGYRSGLVNKVVWVISFVAAYVVAIKFCLDLHELVGIEVYDRNLTIALWFVLLFCAVVMSMHYLGRSLTKVLNLTIAGRVNAILGGILNLGLMAVATIALLNLGSIAFPTQVRALEGAVTVEVALQVQSWIMDSRLLELLQQNVDKLTEAVDVVMDRLG